jgi:hypothetical protein
MVSHRKFVKAWIKAAKASKGVDGVAYEISLTPRQVYSKARYLRKNGVALPRMSYSRKMYKRRGVPTKSLNQLIADSLR